VSGSAGAGSTRRWLARRSRRSGTRGSGAEPGHGRRRHAPKGVDAPITTLKGVKGAAASSESLACARCATCSTLSAPPQRLRQLANHLGADAGRRADGARPGLGAEETNLGRRKGTIAAIGDSSGTCASSGSASVAGKRSARTAGSSSPDVSRSQGAQRSKPGWEPFDGGAVHHTSRLVPVYSTTEGMRSNRPIAALSAKRSAHTSISWRTRCRSARAARADGAAPGGPRAHFPDDSPGRDGAPRLAFDGCCRSRSRCCCAVSNGSSPAAPARSPCPIGPDAFLASLPSS
jgi:hypothetical protein